MSFLSSSTCTNNTHSPLLLIYISVPVVCAHILAGRAGFWNSVLFETLHRMEGNRVSRSVSARLLAAPTPVTTSRQRICTASTCTTSDLDRLHRTGPMTTSTDLNNSAPVPSALAPLPDTSYFWLLLLSMLQAQWTMLLFLLLRYTRATKNHLYACGPYIDLPMVIGHVWRTRKFKWCTQKISLRGWQTKQRISSGLAYRQVVESVGICSWNYS
jgi:hypothetical protein